MFFKDNSDFCTESTALVINYTIFQCNRFPFASAYRHEHVDKYVCCIFTVGVALSWLPLLFLDVWEIKQWNSNPLLILNNNCIRAKTPPIANRWVSVHAYHPMWFFCQLVLNVKLYFYGTQYLTHNISHELQNVILCLIKTTWLHCLTVEISLSWSQFVFSCRAKMLSLVICFYHCKIVCTCTCRALCIDSDDLSLSFYTGLKSSLEIKLVPVGI